MKWSVISGGWRRENEEVRADVVRTVEEILQAGKGIITGGALGVDYIATQAVRNANVNLSDRLRIYLPVPLFNYTQHLYRRAQEGVITEEQADMLVSQLTFIRGTHPLCMVENTAFVDVNPESYYARNTREIVDGDELYAFSINNTEGTQNIIDKAISLGKQVHVKKYTIK